MPAEYRLSVGMMIINQQNKVLVGQRRDVGNWQMPQGGIDIGETPLMAAIRETREEVGMNISQADIHAETKYWYTYDVPKSIRDKWFTGKYHGQKQKWFLIFSQPEQCDYAATTDDEFMNWRWVTFSELLELIVSFKSAVYQAVLQEFRPLIYAKANPLSSVITTDILSND